MSNRKPRDSSTREATERKKSGSQRHGFLIQNSKRVIPFAGLGLVR